MNYKNKERRNFYAVYFLPQYNTIFKSTDLGLKYTPEKVSDIRSGFLETDFTDIATFFITF